MPEQSQPLKIGLVLDDGLDKPDGVQQYILGIGEWLRLQGHDVHYLVGQTARTDIPAVHSLSRNVHVRFNGNAMSIPLPTSQRKLRQFLANEQFDVLHVQVPYSPFMAHRLLKAISTKTAVVGTYHIAPKSGLVAIATRALGIWLRSSLRRFDAMLSVSPAAQAFAKQSFRVDSQVVPNVIDYRRFHKAEVLRQYDDGIKTLLFLGRLVPRKGCRLLIEAARLLNDESVPPFRVVICGTGPLEANLRELVSGYNLDQIVEFAGFVSEADKPRYYASADISVFPSSGGESFGIVLLEAMASGRAVVLAGDNPGYRSVMELQPELLFDPAGAAELARKIKRYLTDPAEAGRLQAWAGAYAEHFDVQTVGRQLLAIYGEALRKRRQM